MLIPFIKKMIRRQIKEKIKNLDLIMFLKGLMDVPKCRLGAGAQGEGGGQK